MKINDKITGYEMMEKMKGVSPGGADRVGKENAAPGGKPQGCPEGDAIVRLSETSKEAQRIKEIVMSQPEVRADKVASAREKIESGDYEVDYQGVADKMVDAFIEDLI